MFVTDKSYRTMKGSGDWKGMISKNSRGESVNISGTRFEFDVEKSGEMWLGNISLGPEFHCHGLTKEEPEDGWIEGLNPDHPSMDLTA